MEITDLFFLALISLVFEMLQESNQEENGGERERGERQQEDMKGMLYKHENCIQDGQGFLYWMKNIK